MKFLIWLAIGFMLVWFLRGKKQHPKSDLPRGEGSDAKSQGGAEEMVQCIHCSVYLPVSEAVFHSSREIFCSELHRTRHLAR
jgi:hypothetical protein